MTVHYSPEPLEGSSIPADSRQPSREASSPPDQNLPPGHHAKGWLPSSGLLVSFFSECLLALSSLLSSLSLVLSLLFFSFAVKIIHSDEVTPQPENERSNEKVRPANNNKERKQGKGERGLVRGKDLRTRKGQMFRKYMQSKLGVP